MKKFFTVCLFITLSFNQAHTQTNFDTTLYNREFIKLSTGELIFADNIEVVESGSRYRANKLIVNGTAYILKRKLFKPHITFYNHLGKLTACYRGVYTPLAKRSGNINFFSPVVISGANYRRTDYPYSVYINRIKKINIPHLRKDFAVNAKNQQAYKTIRKAYRFSAIAFSSLVVPFAGEVNFIVFYFLSRKNMRRALWQYDPTLPQYITDVFKTPLNFGERKKMQIQ